MHKETRRTVILLFAAWSVDYIDRLVINVALPSIGRDLDLNHTELGFIVSAFFLAYAIAQLPGGILADRLGAVRMAIIGLLAWSLFTGLTAVAFSLTSILVVRVLFGFAQGVFPGAAMKLLAERSHPEHRMTANGWVNSSNAFGGVLATLIAAAALPHLGWRGMFLAISLLGVLIALAFLRWMPRPIVPVETSAAHGGARTLLRQPVMWLFVLVFFGYDILVWGANSWAAAYFQEVRGMTPSEAALVVLFPGLAAVVAIIISGRIADRLDGKPQLLIIPAMLIGGSLIVALPHIQNTTVLVIALSVGMGIASFAYIAAFALPLKHLSTHVAGVGSGMILMGGMVAGVIAPTVFGSIVDNASWTHAWSALAVGPAIAIVAALALPRTATGFRVRIDPTLLNTSPTVQKEHE